MFLIFLLFFFTQLCWALAVESLRMRSAPKDQPANTFHCVLSFPQRYGLQPQVWNAIIFFLSSCALPSHSDASNTKQYLDDLERVIRGSVKYSDHRVELSSNPRLKGCQRLHVLRNFLFNNASIRCDRQCQTTLIEDVLA